MSAQTLPADAQAGPRAAGRRHVLAPASLPQYPEDGLLLGNGDLSVSVYRQADRLAWRLGKGDVWDRRIDRCYDPEPAHIREFAHGLTVEGWKCPSYGDAEPVALRGTDNPQRMLEVCTGAPPSYTRFPYPGPKPVGELTLHLPPDLPGGTCRMELTLEEALLRIECTWDNGVRLRILTYIPPQDNVLVVRWELSGWDEATRTGEGPPPLWLSLHRWADPSPRAFAERYGREVALGSWGGKPGEEGTPLPPPAVEQRAGLTVIEQRFPGEPTFPQGFRYLLAPLVEEGQIEQRPQESSGEARLHLLPPAESTEGWAAVAMTTESDPGGAEAHLARTGAAWAGRLRAQGATWERQTQEAAAEFWSRSAVSLEDPLLEDLWYATLHARRCTTRAGKTPPGLFLPSTVNDYSLWHGDYHTNYNYQQPYWGDYVANQIEVGDAYFAGMAYLLQMGRLIAERYYGTRGTFIQLTGYPLLAEDDVLGALPMGRMAYMTGWAASQYWWRYLYTLDRQWLEETGYPALRDCALFYLDFMTAGEDGRYHLFPSNQGESGFTGDPADFTDLPQVVAHARYCLRIAIRAAEVLGRDADLCAQWQERLDQGPADSTPYEELGGLARRLAEHNPPEFGYGSCCRPPAEVITDPWPGSRSWLDRWYPGQYPLAALPLLHTGMITGEAAYAGLRRMVERWRRPNGVLPAMAASMYGHAGAWTESLGFIAPLQEMLLQSFGGVIRLFPVWPTAEEAEFRQLRAEGAFLVSAAWREGTVSTVQIHSEKGAVCRLLSPWPGGCRVQVSGGDAVQTQTEPDDVCSWETRAGEDYAVLPG